jgi:predicted RNase H-like nuclease
MSSRVMRSAMAEPGLVAGVDGCRGGWIAVLWRGAGSPATPILCRHFSDVLALPAKVIAVDMPIGLPVLSSRDAERAVRQLLGKRKSSVFSVPSRATFAARDYPEACAINRRHSEPSRALSKECFNLFPKICEIDALMTPELQKRVFEAHPEVGFRMMNGEAVAFSKKTKEGAALRKSLLREAGFPVEALPPLNALRRDVAPDDILDASALAWVARRIRDGENRRFPAEAKYDMRGLRMEINA